MSIFQNDVEKILKKAGVKDFRLEAPPRPEMGDLALPCFGFAKKERKSPNEIAKLICAKLKPSGSIKKTEVLGPYVNFFADWEAMGKSVLKEILRDGDSFGSSGKSSGKGGGKVMVEFAHPNTHKAFHIGHVRNITLGESLSRILEFSGSRVVRANYQGDIGPHVAKCIWGLLNLKLKEPKENRGMWLGQVYAAASARTSDPKVEEEIKEINKRLYAGDRELLGIWKKTRKWSLDYFSGIYADFGAKFDRFYFESEVEKEGIKLARSLLGKGVAKLSDGAVVMDLEKDGLGVYVLLTQDGTPLYSIKDFVLADLQDKEFRPEKIIHVVGSEQDLHFRQLFRSLGTVNPAVAKKEQHLSYGLVILESGKMKSREGKVILYEDLKEKLLEMACKVTKEKNKKLNKAELNCVSRMVALGALKYDMIKVSPEKTIVFDWDRALSFEGNNAPYLQYTHARCCSIIRKAGKAGGAKAKGSYDASLLKEEKEAALLKKLSGFPETVRKSAREMRPHQIASYIYELCDRFNEFYQSVPVLHAEKDVTAARLALVKAVKITLRNGLELLGIEAPERM